MKSGHENLHNLYVETALSGKLIYSLRQATSHFFSKIIPGKINKLLQIHKHIFHSSLLIKTAIYSSVNANLLHQTLICTGFLNRVSLAVVSEVLCIYPNTNNFFPNSPSVKLNEGHFTHVYMALSKLRTEVASTTRRYFTQKHFCWSMMSGALLTTV